MSEELKFSDCKVCVNKYKQEICRECDYGEMFEERVKKIKFDDDVESFKRYIMDELNYTADMEQDYG